VDGTVHDIVRVEMFESIAISTSFSGSAGMVGFEEMEVYQNGSIDIRMSVNVFKDGSSGIPG
jgi:hypothetical protein